MSHTALLAALTDPALTAPAKATFGYLYACTNGTLTAVVSIDELCGNLAISYDTWRRHRTDLTKAGYLASERDGDILQFTLLGPRALDARDPDDPAHPVRGDEPGPAHSVRDDAAARALGARNGAAPAHPVRGEDDQPAHPVRGDAPGPRTGCAEAGPSAPRGERDDPASPPPCTPPQGIVLNKQQQQHEQAVVGPVPAREASRAERLLLACGVSSRIASEQAARLGLRAVACHVAAWQLARKAKPDLTPGALVDRLANWGEQPLAGWETMRAGVLSSHVTEQDLRSWGLTPPRSALTAYDVPSGFEDIVAH